MSRYSVSAASTTTSGIFGRVPRALSGRGNLLSLIRRRGSAAYPGYQLPRLVRRRVELGPDLDRGAGPMRGYALSPVAPIFR